MSGGDDILGEPWGSRLPLVQYWHSERLPPYIEELTATFREMNPDLDHRVYCEAEAEQFIAERFGFREVEAFQACAVPAMQADYFRYCAVLAHGGIYVDADFRCARPLRELVAGEAGGRLFRRVPRPIVINDFFAFGAPGHPLLRLALEVATANIERRIGEGHRGVWLATGPWIFTGLAGLHRLGSFEAARSTGVADSNFGKIMVETIGDYGRVAEAFEGVRIDPYGSLLDWMDEERSLPYKSGDEHWVGWEKRRGSIYR